MTSGRTSVPAKPRSAPQLARLALLALASAFIAAPTPGNVGGCGGTAASSRITANTMASPQQSAEYVYFDRGLCSYFCLRLQQCGLLCGALANPPENCSAENPEAFRRCVRDELKPQLFNGATTCPHSCAGPDGRGTDVYSNAYEWDVSACGEAVLTRSCDLGGLVSGQITPGPRGSIGTALGSPPTECVNVCR